jgi:hypothetical protein
MTISKDLLAILACPKCKGDVRLSKDESLIICDRCTLLYRIDEDIPVMLIDEAKKVENTENY